MSYKTASGELLEDGGGVIDKGLDKKGFGRSVKGRLLGVLASGTAVTKGNAVLLDGSKGWIIPKSGKIAAGMKEAFKDLVKQYPKEPNEMMELYEQKGIYIFDLWLKNGSAKDIR